jgi:hypothetical protein
VPTALHDTNTSGSSQQTTMATTFVIENFRQASGIPNVYRCASTDGLGDESRMDDDLCISGSTRSHDQFVLEHAGLIFDLRSPSERNEAQAQNWMRRAKFQVVETNEPYYSGAASKNGRCVVRVDVLSPPRFMAYIEANWLSVSEQAQAACFKIISGAKLHELRIEALNVRGLAGLNEAILETGKAELWKALTTLTMHLEDHPSDPVVIHCVQGKDRTGMMVMLLQSLLGVSDQDIVADYFLSNQMKRTNAGSAAAEQGRQRGKLDRKFFSGTNEQAMITTLAFLRNKYGSVSPGYLDAIGFDELWRNRLLAVLGVSPPKSKL